MKHSVWVPCFFAVAVIVLTSGAGAGVLVLPADSLISGFKPAGQWWNLENVSVNDSVFAVDTVFSNKLDTFRVGFANPGGADTLNRIITNVTLYADNRVHYSKGGQLWLWPDYNGIPGPRNVGPLRVGYAETVNKLDITMHDTLVSAFPDTTWHWSNVAGLGMLYQPRTTGVIYYVDQVFAAVTYQDTLQTGNYSFVFSAVSSPQSVGLPFPVTITAQDSSGATLLTYNGSALLWDSKSAVSPVVVSFIAGVSSFDAVVSDTAVADTLFVNDGTATGASDGFALELGGVRRFSIDSIGTQAVNVAFPATITACNYFGDAVTSFSDAVAVWDATGTLTPAVTAPFAGGVGTVNLTVAQAAVADTIFCSHASGAGQSNAFAVAPPLGIESAATVPAGSFSVSYAPNPSRDGLGIDLRTVRPGRISISAYNILGQPVAAFDYGRLGAGAHRLAWRHLPGMASGVYFFVISLDGARLTSRKLIIVR